ncbi:uncharacterized protein LOC113874915 [Abrus precatorius]|uniref:Uncharacterized protein LOC113874915 n=1 Tax=Abrus precatorius TaxID=3816 RepID=A0A8B8MKA0_ABRPR|nr:uncharacterized protein LOC113874915 [Abrus precatorius]
MSHINISETTNFVWNILKSVPLSSGKAQISNHVGNSDSGVGLKGWIPGLSCLKDASYWVVKCVPYLYAYKNDGTGEKMVDKEKVVPTNGQITAKFSGVTKEKLKFLAAHGLEQWWPSDAELQQAIHDNNLISRQLRYLYTGTPWESKHLLNPSCVSFGLSLSNIGQKEEFVWKWNSLKSMLFSSSEAQVSKDMDKTSCVGSKSWIPQLYGLKDASFAVGKWVPHMYSNSSDYISRQLGSLYSATPQVSHLFNLPSVLPTTSLRNTGENAEFVWNRLKSMCPSRSEAQVSNDMTSGVQD